MGNPNQFDWGGEDLVVKSITFSDSPGGTQTALSSGEVSVLDGVTAGTATASKAVVLDSSKGIATITSATITTLTSTTANVTTANQTTDNATTQNAGASGTAGTVSIFPTTASKGKTSLTASDNTGNTTTTINTAAQATTRAYTIPDAGADASFVMTQGAQTLVGVNTFSATPVFSSGVTVTGAATVSTTLGVTGAITPTGGVAAAGGFSASPRGWWVGQTAPQVSTDFNDSTPVITETYCSEIFVPCNCTITGVALFNGSNVTGNVTVALATSAGTTLSSAKSASTAGSGTDAIQRIPFASSYAAVGPATYYIQVQYSSGTARYNTHVLGNHNVVVQTGQTYGTMTNLTPGTAFVTAVGNVAALY